jgi:hypothetical protein
MSDLKQKRGNQSRGINLRSLGTAAALDRNVFSGQTVSEAIPADWHERAKKGWEYYTEEPLVSNAINTWRIFAVGDEIIITCEDEKIQDEAHAMFSRLDLNGFIKDMILQLLAKGDCVGYFNRAADGLDIEQVTCVNPVSVKFKFDNGEMVWAKQVKEISPGMFSTAEDGIELALEQLIHRKWNAPGFSPRGNSMVLPAFESIELLRDYRKAERAIAKRWTTPLRFIQVGGAFGSHLIKPDQRMLQDIRNKMNSMDMEAGMVVPFWVKAETHGIEGKALDTERKVREIKEDILVALGLARSIVAGDGPNFATASISMQKMITMLKEIKQVARGILDWVFDEWKARKGYEDEDITYHFSDLDLHNETDMKKLLLEMYDRGLISKKTLQTKMGLSPDTEESGKESESIVVDTNWSVGDVTQLVALEILTPDEAREYLGLTESAEDAFEKSARKDAEKIYARAYKKSRPTD